MNDKPTILLVVHTADHLIILSDFLETAGYHVLSAMNGTSDIQRAGYAKPNLILMDIRMPDMSGYAACQYLKTQPDLQDIPVVFMSAHQDSEGKDQAIATGGLDFEKKPFHRQEVLTKVQMSLEVHRKSPEARKEGRTHHA